MVIVCFVIETWGLDESDFGKIWLAGIWAMPDFAKLIIRFAVRIKYVSFLMISSGYI
jgi:hypothetical protein